MVMKNILLLCIGLMFFIYLRTTVNELKKKDASVNYLTFNFVILSLLMMALFVGLLAIMLSAMLCYILVTCSVIILVLVYKLSRITNDDDDSNSVKYKEYIGLFIGIAVISFLLLG